MVDLERYPYRERDRQGPFAPIFSCLAWLVFALPSNLTAVSPHARLTEQKAKC